MATFTAYIEFDETTGLFVGTVPGIPGAHTQAASLDELKDNLKEVLELCALENAEAVTNRPRFVGLHQIEIAA